jgi:tRNA(fMet)-specific endonuclease VapC
MIWLLDTNTLLCFANRTKGFERIAKKLTGRMPGEVRMSAISLAELEYAAETSPRPEENRAALKDLRALIGVDGWPPEAARHYAELKDAVKARELPTRPYDLLIAAHARAREATLVTSAPDDFEAMPGLTLENWLKG